MIEKVITFLAHSPTDTTSPLFVALNDPAILALEGVTDKVTIYDTNAQEGNIPYVKMYASKDTQAGPRFLGGSYTEWQTLIVDCIAGGITEAAAQDRAEVLRLEVERVMKGINFASNTGTLADRVSPANPKFLDGIRAFNIVSNTPQNPPQGQAGEYIATSTVNLNLYIEHKRGY